jgi:hypothetical protein
VAGLIRSVQFDESRVPVSSYPSTVGTRLEPFHEGKQWRPYEPRDRRASRLGGSIVYAAWLTSVVFLLRMMIDRC